MPVLKALDHHEPPVDFDFYWRHLEEGAMITSPPAIALPLHEIPLHEIPLHEV